MNINVQEKGAVVVLKPQGPLIRGDADLFKGRLLDSANTNLGRVVLDASAMPYVDSRGLEVLVELTDELSQRGQVLRVCGANETLREVMHLADLDGMFEHFEDAGAAVRSFL